MSGRSWIIVLMCFCVKEGLGQGDLYLIGAGIADITGPAADVPLMGYAKPDQYAGGIHLRLYSRTIITCELDESNCNVFVNMDIATGASAINIKVFEMLRDRGLGELYNEKNTAISATHTHSGPGGYHQFFLFSFTTSGFQDDSFDILVEGVVRSIERAHNNKKEGYVYLNEGELLDTSINRSPPAYMNNPSSERRRYDYDTDKDMTIAKFVGEDGTDIALISWYAVHPVSMNNSNHLISSDNKGYASYLFEQDMNDGAPMGQGDFVAIFANANHGDTSPNTAGPRCIDTGGPCRYQTSTCNDRAQLCIAFGPGEDMFDSTRIIGENQYVKAKELYNSATTEVAGPVGSVYQNANMTHYPVKINETYTTYTCAAAMGYSFAAGTVDGPGEFTFFQGDTTGNDLWDAIRDLIKKPSDELIQCQAPKPVLLPTGEMFTPWTWAPAVVQTQILRIGQLAINLVPGEFTTMAGRRLRDSVRDVFRQNGVMNVVPVLTGLANVYTDYVTTFEEYQIQRYEGASTVFGQYTLQAYQQQYAMLAEFLVDNTSPDPGPPSENYLDEQQSFLEPPSVDAVPKGVSIGDVYIDTDRRYRQGGVASATFWAGSPRHDAKAMIDSTFVSVEELHHTGDTHLWIEVFNDADWSTRFYWEKKVVTEDSTQSLATIRFEIPSDMPLGTYRIRHQGFYKTKDGNLQHYEGFSSSFEVIRKNYKRGESPIPTTAMPTTI
ncbi:putative neutral ceramidase C [Amphiura filiformis]|uniref:putative neutral ceramidase C n=1 Tax=Amphiura filiformis TaxID=82378 RepID=UPI003B21BDCF